MATTPRLKEKFVKEIASALKDKFQYKSAMQVPKLTKIVVNKGIGAAVADKKLVELIQARNSAESTLHGFRKDFDAYRDQVTEEERTKAEAALQALDEAIAGDDVEAINTRTTELYQAIGPITGKKYEAEQKAKESSDKKDDNVVDAEVKAA